MEFSHFDIKMMKKTISIAKSINNVEVPVAALIVRDGIIIAKGRNSNRKNQTVHQHAEINAINKAFKVLEGKKLNECTLYTTLEPCVMCTGAIIHARIQRVVIATLDPKGGGMISSLNVQKIPFLNKYPIVDYGLLKEEASNLLTTFFQGLRE